MRLNVFESFGLAILLWFVLGYLVAVVWFTAHGDVVIAGSLLAVPLLFKLCVSALRFLR